MKTINKILLLLKQLGKLEIHTHILASEHEHIPDLGAATDTCYITSGANEAKYEAKAMSVRCLSAYLFNFLVLNENNIDLRMIKYIVDSSRPCSTPKLSGKLTTRTHKTEIHEV